MGKNRHGKRGKYAVSAAGGHGCRCAEKNGEDNIITVAWAGTVCTNPPMVSISVRPERYSYQMIKESGAFRHQPDDRRTSAMRPTTAACAREEMWISSKR